MSRFLKIIVHFIVICTIVCVVGLAVPPFLGITTEIVDDSAQDTNLPLGSVTYAIPVRADEVSIGDSLLVETAAESGSDEEDGQTSSSTRVYRYMITEIDLENSIFKVVDPTVSGGETITVSVKEYVPRIVITIGYVGYLLIATESIEGLIVLGLAVLFIIILYIIAELWKKDPQEAYDEEDPAAGYIKSKKELKQEEKERARMYKEEERQIKREGKQRKKGKKQERKKIRTGGFVDEIYEDELEQGAKEGAIPAVQTATSEAHELLKKEIAAATAEEPEAVQAREVKEESPLQKTAVVAPQIREMMKEQSRSVVSPTEEEDSVEEVRKMAVPSWSAAQIAEFAKSQGDAPEIIKDDITRVTLFDYSDIIAEELPHPAEE